MNARTQIIISSLLIVLVLFASACAGPAATPVPAQVERQAVSRGPAAAPTQAPAPTQAALAKPGAVSRASAMLPHRRIGPIR